MTRNNMTRTRVKICGITRVEDAVSAVNAGADAIGLVFYAPSPRAVTIAQAQAIVAAMPPFVSVVGLFVNAPQTEIESVLSNVDRKSTRLNSSHLDLSRMPSSA